MPTVVELGLGVDLAACPSDYPGPPAPGAGLLDGAELLALGPSAGGGAEELHVELQAALAARGVAQMDRRTPVVAVGSNANPDVMRRKLSHAGVSGVLPMTTDRIHGVAVGHSAHVSAPGYVPAAPFRLEGAVAEVVVTWLDPEQLDAVDRTEPSYVRAVLGGEGTRVLHVYVSRWGVITPPPGEPLPLCAQAELWEGLVATWRECPAVLGRTAAAEVAASLADRPSLRSAVRDTLAASGWAAPSGIGRPDRVTPRSALG